MGRRKLWAERMVPPFAAGTFRRITAVLKEDEDRTDFLRAAVARELAARGAPATHDGPGRPRAPPKLQRERVRVERCEEPLLIDNGDFARALIRATASGDERATGLAAGAGSLSATMTTAAAYQRRYASRHQLFGTQLPLAQGVRFDIEE
jgi:hypothetical protein